MLREQTAASPERMVRALAGLRAYQQAPRGEPPARPPIVARQSRAVLHDYGGDGRPLLVVPSLINPPWVLDMAPDQSLLRHLSAQGHRVLLLDWGSPDPAERDLDIAGHVETLLLPLIATLPAPPILVGYCLGGTMALAAAHAAPVRAVVTIAAPWRFAGFSDSARQGMADLFMQARAAAEVMGLLPMEVLQTAFWRLDPGRTVAKFEGFAAYADQPERAARFVALEDWANDGPPLTLAAGRDLAEAFFANDRTGAGEWHVAGQRIDPATLTVPLLDIVSTTDRIVPAASAHGAGERLDLALGHVGMIVGGRAKGAMWDPLDRWLAGR